MSWVGIGGAAATAVIGGAMSDGGKSNGGAGTQTQSSEPWRQAQPWIMNNLASGQRLQSQYEAQPFNAQQQQAFQNQANQGAYMRAAVPSLLRQMQGQQVGFDRSNPNARPAAFNWDGLLSAAKDGQAAQAAQGGGGLLDMLSNGGGAVNSSLTPMAAPAPKQDEGTFIQQDMGYTPLQQTLIDQGRNPWMMGYTQSIAGGAGGPGGTGGYGAYHYGDNPTPGTPAYRDMMEYFMRGGNDPWNIAPGGMGIKRLAGPGGYNGNGAATDDGGAAAAVGSSANF
jgi:hypothetical protein